jgi:hypothetical protein
MKTAVVIGSGIAGLSLSEFISRHKDWKVILLEKNKYLGGDASQATQKWYHSGWLYSAMPEPAAFNACVEATNLLHTVYSEFGDEEVNIEKLISRYSVFKVHKSNSGWFINDPIYYMYAKNTPEMSFALKVSWPLWLKYVIYRRLRRFGLLSKSAPFLSKAIEDKLNALKKWWDLSYKSKYDILRSSDIQIDTGSVMRSLVSRLGSNTEIILNSNFEIKSYNNRSRIKITDNLYRSARIIDPDLCILATGSGTTDLLRDVNRGDLASNIKSIKSPIVVLKKLLDLPSFIRFTPVPKFTVNHIKYKISRNGALVSTIGSYLYCDINDSIDLDTIYDYIERWMGRYVTIEDIAGVYFGVKTEYTKGKDRRYNHALEVVNSNTIMSLAGKFSQFPLLVKDFADIHPQFNLYAAPNEPDYSLKGRLIGDSRIENLTQLL